MLPACLRSYLHPSSNRTDTNVWVIIVFSSWGNRQAQVRQPRPSLSQQHCVLCALVAGGVRLCGRWTRHREVSGSEGWAGKCSTAQLQPQPPAVGFGCLLSQATLLSTQTVPRSRGFSVNHLRIFTLLFLEERRVLSLRKIQTQSQFLNLLKCPLRPAPVGLGVECSVLWAWLSQVGHLVAFGWGRES